ncbi:MAG: cupin domain-containing protein [Pseudomonadota bacterium]
MIEKTGVQRVSHSDSAGTGLAEWEAMDPDSLVSGTPVQRGWLADENPETGYLAGVWDCTAFVDEPGTYGVDEFMLLLEGTVVMKLPDGSAVTVEAGEAFVVPKGLACQWSQPGYVRKVFMIVDDPARNGPTNPSLSRITKPPLAARSLADAIACSDTFFESATGKMTVCVRSHAGGLSGESTAGAHELFHVLEGGLTLVDGGRETRFVAGETGYISAGTTLARSHETGTRILEAVYRP